MSKVCLAGDDWGAHAAFQGLLPIYGKDIEVLSNDESLLSLARKIGCILIASFDESSAKLVLCAGYKPIINTATLSKKTFLNIHYSILPKYRGFHSTVWAIINNEAELGLTVYRMNQHIDDGPILVQHSLPNDGTSTSRYYIEKLNGWVQANIGRVVEAYLNGDILEEPQNKTLATWFGRRGKEDCKIDFAQPHRYIQNMFRVLVPPYPLPFIRQTKAGNEFNVLNVEYLYCEVQNHIGRILNIDDTGIYVSSAQGYVILKELEDRDGNRIDQNIFKIGTYLG